MWKQTLPTQLKQLTGYSLLFARLYMEMKKHFKQIPASAVFILSVLVLLSAGVDSVHASGLKSFSLESTFAIDRGNLEKTEFGGETSLGAEIFEGKYSEIRGRLEVDKFEGEDTFSNEWRADLLSEVWRPSFWALNFGSFAEADERDSLDLRYGLGFGVSTDFTGPASLKFSPEVDIFYEGEEKALESPEKRAALRIVFSVKREAGGLKPSSRSVFVIPFGETDDWRNESEISLEYPLLGFVSLTLKSSLKYQNKPAADAKKSDFSTKAGLKFKVL